MLTVGLVKEFLFISKALGETLHLKLFKDSPEVALDMRINPVGDLDIFYAGYHIWSEKVEGDTSFFGVESCDTIARIIACIDNGTTWEHLKWTDCLDKKPSPV